MTGASRVTEVHELEITSLAAGGDGVGRVDGLAVFVPRTAPGDRVRAVVTTHGSYGRGVIDAMITASPRRVAPPCIHFTRDDCGSCQWQHIAIDAQREAKAQLVVDAFARIAHRAVPTPVVAGTEEELGYRRTISFTVRGRGRRRVGGFRTVYSPNDLIAIDRCLLAHPALQECWRGVQTQLAELPVPDGARGRPELRVTLRRDDDGAMALVVEGGRSWGPERAAAIAARVASLKSVWWRPFRGPLQCVWSTEGAASAAASFAQVNAGVAELLHARVLALVVGARQYDRDRGGTTQDEPYRVVDAYAGRGAVAASLTEIGCAVVAIERDPAAAEQGASRLAPPSRMVVGAVEERLGDALPADLVILNPPRAGVDAAVTARLRHPGALAGTPRWLVYVSCDPATLARDVARLEGWTVSSLDCYDMFPHTAHVETVCLLRPEGQ